MSTIYQNYASNDAFQPQDLGHNSPHPMLTESSSPTKARCDANTRLSYDENSTPPEFLRIDTNTKGFGPVAEQIGPDSRGVRPDQAGTNRGLNGADMINTESAGLGTTTFFRHPFSNGTIAHDPSNIQKDQHWPYANSLPSRRSTPSSRHITFAMESDRDLRNVNGSFGADPTRLPENADRVNFISHSPRGSSFGLPPTSETMTSPSSQSFASSQPLYQYDMARSASPSTSVEPSPSFAGSEYVSPTTQQGPFNGVGYDPLGSRWQSTDSPYDRRMSVPVIPKTWQHPSAISDYGMSRTRHGSMLGYSPVSSKMQYDVRNIPRRFSIAGSYIDGKFPLAEQMDSARGMIAMSNQHPGFDSQTPAYANSNNSEAPLPWDDSQFSRQYAALDTSLSSQPALESHGRPSMDLPLNQMGAPASRRHPQDQQMGAGNVGQRGPQTYSASAPTGLMSDQSSLGHPESASTPTSRNGSVDGREDSASQLKMMSMFNARAPTAMHKKHICNICMKRFTRPSSLQTHKYSHTAFVCNYEGCGRQFSVISNLRRHRKIHGSLSTDDSNFQDTAPEE